MNSKSERVCFVCVCLRACEKEGEISEGERKSSSTPDGGDEGSITSSRPGRLAKGGSNNTRNLVESSNV